MTPSVLAAFHPERKNPEQPGEFSAETSKVFRQNKAAWKNYQAFPPYYRRVTAGWIESAKKPETKIKRLERLIRFAEANKKIDFMKNSKQ